MKANKYHAHKVKVDGITFHSRKESARYCELKLLENAGEISNLFLQPRFEIAPTLRYRGTTHRVRFYIADFKYQETTTGETVVEDVKGFKTPLYKLKRHIFLLKYGASIKFIET